MHPTFPAFVARSSTLLTVGLAAGLAACSARVAIEEPTAPTLPESDPGTGWETGPWEQPEPPEPDTSMWDGAQVRILSPEPDGLVPIEDTFPFEAAVFGADGQPIEGAPSRVRWFSSGDPDFQGEALSFDAEPLAIGTHEITVVVDMPNGERTAHSIGGVKVQSAYAGTYAGLFSVDGTVNNITITCTGAAVVSLEPQGEAGEGAGECLVSILGIDVPMTWDFSLLDDTGTLTGEASVNLVGFFSYDVPMTSGTVDPAGDGLQLDFAGNIPFIGTLAAFLEAPRVSLDSTTP